MDGGELTMQVRWDNVNDVVAYRRGASIVPTFTTAERMKTALETGPGSYRTLIDVLNSDSMYDTVNEAELRVASRELLASGSIAIDHQGVIRLTKGEDSPSTDAPTIPLALDVSDNVDS
jgi:hemin uptake protein HemP